VLTRRSSASRFCAARSETPREIRPQKAPRRRFNVVEGPGSFAAATFLRNRADWNGGLGIETNNGTDLGKNHAHKNGDPRQCVGIECRP
jgi:hypothetical protein